MAGVRSSKTVGGTTYNYDTLSGKVMRQTWDGNVIDFIYDENNRPFAFKYDGTVYYYVLNVQGDVVGLLNSIGVIIAEYTYDPWGKLLSINTWGELPGENEWYRSVAEATPLRYRGYYYDTETGFYYLQSRYYDPEIGRFINADTYTTTDADGILSSNMFAYCENNPVMGVDPTGEWVHLAIGAAIGAISSVATSYLSSKATGRDYSLLDAVVDAVSGAASGALAATGVGVLGQTVGNAAIGVTKGLVGGETSVSEIVENAIEGGVGGIIGGKGASYGNAKSITRSGEQLVKRIFKYKDPVKIAYGHYKKTAHRQGKEFVLKALWKSARNVSAYNFVGGLFR